MTFRIVVIGQIVVDELFPEPRERGRRKPRPTGTESIRIGGKAFNIAIALARFGCNVEIISAVGGDDEGKLARDLLLAEGVGVDHLTSCVFGRDKSISTPRLQLTEGQYAERLVQLKIQPDIDACYLRAIAALSRDEWDCLILTLEFSDRVVTQLSSALRSYLERSDRTLCVANPAPRQDRSPSPLVFELLHQADALVPNRFEAAWLIGDLRGDLPDTETASRLLDIYQCREAYVTYGADGWSWAAKRQGVGVKALDPAPVVDKVGASDVFTAVVTALRMRGASCELASFVGGVAARISVARQGGAESFPSREEVVKVLREDFGEQWRLAGRHLKRD